VPNITSDQAVTNPGLLAAVTVQTGHDPGSRQLLWRLPARITKNNPNVNFINLEPWYEGILDGRFGVGDQLYAYWATMLAGAQAYCYGAHGIWNVGDGKFLAHWGAQTFEQAKSLKAPKLIGMSHRLFLRAGLTKFDQIKIDEQDGKLIEIRRTSDKGKFISYIPEISLVSDLPKGRYFLPLEGKIAGNLPERGQLVIYKA